LVWRQDAGGRVQVLLVHRPKYDDWTLPKGKLDPGETHEEAAVREVLEETGFHCRLGTELATTTYRDRFGRPKRVRYWDMQVTDGDFVPNREVDELCWADPDTASRLLSYPRDREVVGSLSVAR
jgi:8-oxo-dGTP diphosphatase